MFRIVTFSRLIKVVVGLTVFFSIGVYAIVIRLSPETSLYKLFAISSFVAGLLIFLIGTSFTARRIWSLVRFFDGSLFPDINGTWEGEITFEGGQLTARAVIRQTISHTQIDLHTPTSKSITLESTPVSESGQPRLYYVHRVTPQNPNWYTYTGSTLFDVRCIQAGGKKVLELSGHYYTDRKTNGRIRLRQIGKDCAEDVSYY
ncbi:Cap15 family cyclic dinucleotide receptor domain-containing protein [Lelliottia jeotgali]